MATERARDPGIDITRVYIDELSAPLLQREDEVRLATVIEQAVQSVNTVLGSEHAHLPLRSELLIELDALDETAPVDSEMLHVITDGYAARDLFIQSNLRLVVNIAKRYAARSNIDLVDLIQEGNIGLMRAVDMFDYKKGFKFSTYASWWIKQSITRGIDNDGTTIRVPVHQREVNEKVRKRRIQLTHELGRIVTDDELSSSLDLSLKEVVKAERIMRLATPLSLDQPLGEDTDATFGGTIADTKHSVEVTADKTMLESEVMELLALLTDRERQVLIWRYGLDGGAPETLDMVGKRYGLTRERIRQIESKAIKKVFQEGIKNPEHIAGLLDLSTEKFGDIMTERRKELGLDHTRRRGVQYAFRS